MALHKRPGHVRFCVVNQQSAISAYEPEIPFAPRLCVRPIQMSLRGSAAAGA